MKNWRIILVCGWIFAVVLFLYAWGVACAADLQVSWNANVEADLAGYKVSWAAPGDSGWSQADGQWTFTGPLPHEADVGNVLAYTIPGIAEGPYAVAIQAYDTSGNYSEFSTVAAYLYDLPPSPLIVPPINIPPDTPVQVIINLVTE